MPADPNALAQVDRELEALGAVPADARALIARYAGDDLSGESIDRMLEALSANVALPAMPPSLQPTLVEQPAPQVAVLETSAFAPATNAANPATVKTEEHDLPSKRTRLPWESDVPDETEAAAQQAAVAVPPSPVPSAMPQHAAPDFDTLFGDESVAPSPQITHAAESGTRVPVLDEVLFEAESASLEIPRQLSRPPSLPVPGQNPSRPPPLRKRFDTVKDMPAAQGDNTPDAQHALELSALDKVLSEPPLDPTPAPLSVMPPTWSEDAPTDVAAQPAAAASDEEEDEFEILVDDEILEIDEDEP